MTKKLPKFGQKHIQQSRPIPIINLINLKKALFRHIVIKLLKTMNKEQMLKGIREKMIHYIQEASDSNDNGVLIRNHGGENTLPWIWQHL